ncbi:MAG: VWA domain-containing protein [Burkholderiales bacterium]|jgi:VWFA-related protein
MARFRGDARLGLALLLAAVVPAPGQTPPEGPQRPPSAPTLPAVRTELVQLDVTVSDKSGRNAVGLTARDFVLLEDGRPQALSHFAVGGRAGVEETAAAAPSAVAPAAPAVPPPPVAPRGRHVVLLVDDLHTAQVDLPQAQIAMRKFVTEQVSVDDRVAVVTTSGSGGVFQDFTGDSAALVRAIARVRSRYDPVEVNGRPYLTEHQAELIDRGDVEALRVATQEILQIDDYLGEEMAKQQAYLQARRMVVEITQRSGRALGVIESVVRGLEPLAGRKIVVLVSDGFLIGLGALETTAFDVRKIADAATRSGVVLYSLDTRGLVSEPPGGQASFRGPGVLSAPGMRTDLQSRSVEALRQGMNALAVDTGGFLVKNSNDLDQGLGRILRDNETYYLLAYEPSNATRDGSFRKIQVRLRGRPELKVRTRSGYFAPDERQAAPAAQDPAARREREIAQALGSLFPLQDLPLELSADFIALPPQGAQAVLKIHLDLRNVPFERKDDRYRADLEIVGAVYDEEGKLVGDVAGEKAQLNLTAENYVGTIGEGMSLLRSVPLPPGQYQVRLAAREASRSLLGSASQWVEIPDLDAQPLTLSSVFLLADAPIKPRPDAKPEDAPERAVTDAQVGKVFRPGQGMHYTVQLYTPSKAKAGPVTLQAQVWRGSKLVGVTPKHELEDAPGGRKWSERISLDAFAPGEYELRVVATDPGTGAKAERRVSFRVEA